MMLSRIGPSIHVECFFPQHMSPENYGSLKNGDLINKLKSLKVSDIELKYYSSCDPDSIIRTVNILRETDLAISIHAKWGKTPFPQSFSECFPALEKLPREEEIIITTHPLEPDDSDTEKTQLAIQNTRAFTDLACILKREKRRHRIAIELMRQKTSFTFGVNYRELLNLLEEVGDTNFGICWDFGHTFYNSVYCNLPLRPPAEFLKNTIHTHIHSVFQGSTHFSLTRGDVPLERWVNWLLDTDYSGLFVLELIYRRMQKILTSPKQIFSEFVESREKLAHLLRNG